MTLTAIILLVLSTTLVSGLAGLLWGASGLERWVREAQEQEMRAYRNACRAKHWEAAYWEEWYANESLAAERN